MAEERAWGGATFGNRWMHTTLVRLLRFMDVRFFYAFNALFVVIPSLLCSRGGKAIYGYFRRHQHRGPLHSLWLSYRNGCLQAQTVVDKFAMYAGRKFHISVDGQEYFDRLEQRPEGFLMLSSHIGNYEIAGYTLISKTKAMNALVFGGEKATVMQGRQAMFRHTNIHMIELRQGDTSYLFELNAALARGEILSIPADRSLGSRKTVPVTLLGSKAPLPMGPFSIAAMRGLQVIMVNVMKTSLTGYTIHVRPLDYDRSLPQREQIQQMAEGYAAELDRLLHRYPCQWFNYFDFWHEQ